MSNYLSIGPTASDFDIICSILDSDDNESKENPTKETKFSFPIDLYTNEFEKNNSTSNTKTDQIPETTEDEIINFEIRYNEQKNDQSLNKNISIKLPKTAESLFLTKFNVNIGMNVIRDICDIIHNNGLSGSHFYLNSSQFEIAKTIISIIYLRLPVDKRERYKKYIESFMEDPKLQILKTPFKEITEPTFVELFNGYEQRIIQNIYNIDCAFKIAMYISTEKLPEKFIFVPEMDTPLGWTAFDDYLLLTSIFFVKKNFDVLTDSKLPFSSMNKVIRPSKEWVKNRISLICKEVSLITSKGFSFLKKNDSELVFKKFNDAKFFGNLNRHVIYHNALTVHEQKKLLRIFYLYGIPEINGISKIRKLMRNITTNPKLILLFIIKVLMKAIKYKPKLRSLLLCFPKMDDPIINDSKLLDINWIKEEAIQSVASNLYLLYRIRSNFKWVNGIDRNKDDYKDYFQSFSLPYWAEILNDMPFWNLKHDKLLFNVTAYYGFLLNSMLTKFICPKFPDNEALIKWKEEEMLTLTPIKNEMASSFFPLFDIETRIKRLNQILDAIEKVRNGNE